MPAARVPLVDASRPPGALRLTRTLCLGAIDRGEDVGDPLGKCTRTSDEAERRPLMICGCRHPTAAPIRGPFDTRLDCKEIAVVDAVGQLPMEDVVDCLIDLLFLGASTGWSYHNLASRLARHFQTTSRAFLTAFGRRPSARHSNASNRSSAPLGRYGVGR